MPFKINISEKTGKTYKLEADAEPIIEKSLHDIISGKDISPDLEGYEFEITGASDKSGFTAMKNVEGIGVKKELLTYGKGMKKRPRKEGKRKLTTPNPKGLRLRKNVRGKVISPAITQINLKIVKEGSKKLSEIFPEQNKPKEEPQAEKSAEAQASAEAPKEEVPKEQALENKGSMEAEDKSQPKEKPEEETKPEEKSNE